LGTVLTEGEIGRNELWLLDLQAVSASVDWELRSHFCGSQGDGWKALNTEFFRLELLVVPDD
jgi:hypothetical protein